MTRARNRELGPARPMRRSANGATPLVGSTVTSPNNVAAGPCAMARVMGLVALGTRLFCASRTETSTAAMTAPATVVTGCAVKAR